MSYDVVRIRFNDGDLSDLKYGWGANMVPDPTSSLEKQLDVSSADLIVVDIPGTALRWSRGTRFLRQGELFEFPYKQFSENVYYSFAFDRHGKQTFLSPNLIHGSRTFGELNLRGWALKPDVKRKINKLVVWAS